MAISEEHRVRDDRLRWQCRRALLELDILFARFWAAQAGCALTTAEAEELAALLALEDHALWQLVAIDDGAKTGNAVLQRLRTL